ncbi:hypothetical protein IJJ27_01150 [bacterium]|nr:hypothetical protein [bacterium]MBQ6436152.1 hypothetical protein [bacterium]
MKRRGRHTTVIEGLSPLLRELERHPEIEISCGRITAGLPVGRHRMKWKQLSGGIEVTYRGTCSKQILHLYGDGKEIEDVLKNFKI